MTLSPRTRLGPYEVIAQIGVGGMGEVYRATDTNLKRAVAIKVLPASVATDAERLARFRREAEVLAALSHPNIAAIYGLERTGTTIALVMEFVEGPTLAERIAHGAIPLDEALSIATQTAEALEAAHELNIVHRDLKPANIKVRPDGTVKVLDFGLAKAMEPASALRAAAGQASDGAPGVSQSPTITTPAMTQAGMILGTAAYMSPEQARGRAVDERSDVWALGAVLFEMLTGERAFAGEDVSDTLASVLKTEPAWEHLPAGVPPRVRQVMRACLQKNTKQRIGAVQDVRLALEGAFDSAVPLADSGGIGSRRKERLVWLSALAMITLLAAVQSARVWWPGSPVPAASPMRFDIAMPSAPAATIAVNELESLAISPDGLKIVFVSVADGRSRLWLRSLDSVSARPLAGTDLAILPFWSPDSRSVAFFANGQLKRIDIDGGSARILARAPFGLGGTWNTDGTILLTPLLSGPIYRIPATGGEPAALTKLARGQNLHRRPRFLPDGRHFFYYATGAPDVSGVYVGQLDGTEPRRLLDAESAVIHQSSGRILFISQGTLYSQGFDMTGLALTGNRSPVAEDVAAVSISDTGLVAYRTGSVAEQRRFVWLDRSGHEIGGVGGPDYAGNDDPALSPDGRYIAMHRTVDGNPDIWLLETTRGVLSRFTTESGWNYSPRWSPDSSQLVFNSNRSGVFDLYLQSMANTGSDQLLLATPQNKSVTDWSRDGRFILFRSVDPETSHDLWALPLEGDKKPFPVVRTSFVEPYGQFSPDGKWVAYQSNESGRAEVYAQPFPGPGAKIKISTDGGAQMRWRRDGKELFYLALDSRLMAVPLRAGSDDRGLEPGDPTPLFTAKVGELVPLQSGYAQSYDIAPDGQRFLMNTLTKDVNPPPITVILNWLPK